MGIVRRLHPKPPYPYINPAPALRVDHPRGMKRLEDTHYGKDICSGSFGNQRSFLLCATKKAGLFVNLKDLDLDELVQRQIIQAVSAHPFNKRPIDMKDAHLD